MFDMKHLTDDPKNPTLLMTGVPGWLQPEKQDRGNLHTEATIEKALSLLEAGYSVAQICREHPDMPDPTYLYRWFRETPEIEQRYYEARRLGAEVVMDECIDIADGKQDNGNEILEDVQRSKLRIETRMKYAARMDPDRFGDKKQIDVGVTVDISEAMERAQQRAVNMRKPNLIEGEWDEN